MQRLESLSGRTVHLRRGLVWRDGDELQQVLSALTAEGVPHEVVDPADVGPGASALLDELGVVLPLRPRLEQVVHFGDLADPAATDGYACVVDRAHLADDGAEVPSVFAMPHPGAGLQGRARSPGARPRRR